jgi:signal transduction histidine kinase
MEGRVAGSEPAIRVTTFESEIDPLEMSLLDSGQFVLFRKVWRNGERQIQGLLIEQQPFIWDIVRGAFNATALANMADLSVSYRGQALGRLNGHSSRYDLSRSNQLHGELLYQTALSAPLGDIELVFTITLLPIGPEGQVVLWNAGVLALVLLSGFYLLYRLGVGQIKLARQQQDFVSAVSHELKTPLTSIRMYGEMLRAGWVNEEKRSRYYDYIFYESERLSRLINNVLQLARMTRSELPVNLCEMSLAEWMEMARAKVGVQIERAGFKPVFQDCSAHAGVRLKLDPDHFTQIMINLIDNAIKFSAKQNKKRIDIGCELLGGKTALISVRDYGPGIAKEQMKKIFTLFYRSENELTRETVGTGIGLALVHQMVLLMDGRIDVINQKPGAEFRLYFPVVTK